MDSISVMVQQELEIGRILAQLNEYQLKETIRLAQAELHKRNAVPKSRDYYDIPGNGRR